MNRSHFGLFSLVSLARASLVTATLCGTIGLSTVASAQETARPAPAALPAPGWTMSGPGFTLGSAGLQLLGPSLNVVTPPPPAPPPPPPPAEPTPLAKIFLNLPGVVVQPAPRPAP